MCGVGRVVGFVGKSDLYVVRVSSAPNFVGSGLSVFFTLQAGSSGRLSVMIGFRDTSTIVPHEADFASFILWAGSERELKSFGFTPVGSNSRWRLALSFIAGRFPGEDHVSGLVQSHVRDRETGHWGGVGQNVREVDWGILVAYVRAVHIGNK